MGLADNVRSLAAGGLDMARQRLELATLDVEEQVLHAGRMLVLLVLVTALGTLALAALAALLVAWFWDSARLQALLAVALVFAAAAVLAWRALRGAIAQRPALLAATLQELRRDGEQLGGRP